MWTHVYTRHCTPVHCLARLTGSGSQLSDVVMSGPSAVCVVSPLQQIVLQSFGHTLLQMLLSSLQHSLQLQWEVTQWTVRDYFRFQCIIMFAMFTVKCGSLWCDGPCERFSLWIAAVKECSWWSKCYWKSVKLCWSHPTFLGGLGAIKLVNGGWWWCAVSIKWEPGWVKLSQESDLGQK